VEVSPINVRDAGEIERAVVAGGGLMSYGPELVINLKTAKALGAPRATDADRTHRRDDRVAVRRMSPMGPSRHLTMSESLPLFP
jgi:hypothetical protein